jgi:hypothetical protein
MIICGDVVTDQMKEAELRVEGLVLGGKLIAVTCSSSADAG